MSGPARKRARMRIRSFETAPWFQAPPARRPFPLCGITVCIVALLCLARWATAAEVLVASARLERGRVLSCKYLVGTRVVERQYLDAVRGADQHGCPLVNFDQDARPAPVRAAPFT
jgi:hypothetical protein